jgi:YHS domain-containing protein
MKKMNYLLAFILVLALGIVALAHEKHGQKAAAKPAAKGKVEFIGKGDGVTTCPVTGEEIHNKDNKAVLFKRTVYFCCAGCMDEVKKNPAAYLKPTHKAQLLAIKNLPKTEEHHGKHVAAPQAETKFLGKGDGVDTCPVTGEPVNKNLKGEANGQEFYVCCEGCLDTVKKNPAAYLKPAKIAFLGKGDGVDTCPVTGELVNKNLKGEANGQEFYVCCEGCLDTVKKNPAAYLKKK